MNRSTTYTVLAVDDYEPHLYALSRTLSAAGFEVMTASTGTEALERAAAAPDLILLDIGLPDFSGLEVCDRLKLDAATHDIPVIFITATHGDEFLLMEAEKRGASGFFTYPLNGTLLIEVIRACLEQLERLQSARRARSGPIPSRKPRRRIPRSPRPRSAAPRV